MSALNLLLVPSIARSDPQSLTISPWTAWAQMAVFVLLALVGVGLFLRRGIRTTLERLNLRGISLPQFGVAVGAVVGTQLVVWGIDFVWKMLSPASFASVSQIGQALFGNFVGVAGALTLGISAGIGEEMLFRGAIQPRFGFWATAVLFMVAHTQYTISPALLEILVLAVVLGVLRDRTSTTVCILVHAAYNALTMLMPVPF
jgi:membrane protease YdiL (CAAX protease family)